MNYRIVEVKATKVVGQDTIIKNNEFEEIPKFVEGPCIEKYYWIDEDKTGSIFEVWIPINKKSISTLIR